MFLILLPLATLANIQDDLSKASHLNEIVTSLLKLTQDNYLNQIQEQLKGLEQEIEKTEKSVGLLEYTIVNLAQNHANFNSTEANLVKNIVNSMDEYISVLDAKVRSVDFSLVKSTIPRAITGQAAGDFQAFHSIDKIKKESLKLESSTFTNSNYIWVVFLTTGTVIMSLYLTYLITKACNSNI